MIQLKFKNKEVFKSSFNVKWHQKLIEVLLDFPGIKIVTCAYEKRGYATLHSTNPLRAIDLRSWVFKNPEKIAEYMNNRWAYDPKRPNLKVVLCHDAGLGKHFHVQVHKNTERK